MNKFLIFLILSTLGLIVFLTIASNKTEVFCGVLEYKSSGLSEGKYIRIQREFAIKLDNGKIANVDDVNLYDFERLNRGDRVCFNLNKYDYSTDDKPFVVEYNLLLIICSMVLFAIFWSWSIWRITL